MRERDWRALRAEREAIPEPPCITGQGAANLKSAFRGTSTAVAGHQSPRVHAPGSRIQCWLRRAGEIPAGPGFIQPRHGGTHRRRHCDNDVEVASICRPTADGTFNRIGSGSATCVQSRYLRMLGCVRTFIRFSGDPILNRTPATPRMARFANAAVGGIFRRASTPKRTASKLLRFHCAVFYGILRRTER